MGDFNNGDDFVQSEGGVYIPTPTDLRKCVVLRTSDKESVLVDFPDIRTAAAWVCDCISGNVQPIVISNDGLIGEWFEATHPFFGEPMLLSDVYLRSVTSIGYSWEDVDAIEEMNMQRRAAKLARKSGQTGQAHMPVNGSPMHQQHRGQRR